MPSPVEEIKKRIDVVDLVGSYLRLSKAGVNFKALCPFHHEKTPSFYVSPSRETWHRFGCGVGGDVFQFVQQMEGVEFLEALELLARRAGITLRKEDPRLTSERKRFLNLLEEAASYYQAELLKRKDVQDYLESRGLKSETIKSFRLGFAPDSWDGVLNFLKSKGYRPEEIEKSGLAIRRESYNFYDRFRSRIIFPVWDASGRIVGFSGRIFGPSFAKASEGEAKYINTPNTILYDKSRILYLWDRAKNEVRKEDACILVEGQMDALLSHQAGVANAVATSGTALTRGHLGLVKRLGSKILLAFDTDSAGELAARRAVELAFEEGLEVNIIEIPEGKDPAETICENPLLWRQAVDGAKPVIAYFLNNLKEKSHGDLHKLRSEAKILVLPYLVRLEDEVEKAHWVQELAKTLGSREEPLWSELGKLVAYAKKGEKKEDVKPPGPSAGLGPGTRRQLVEVRILGLVAWRRGEFLEKLGEEQKAFFSEEYQPLLGRLLDEAALPGGELEIRLSKLALEAELLYEGLEDLSGEFRKLWGELEGEVARARLEFLSGEIRRMELAGEKERLAQHLKEFQETSQRLNYLWQESRAKN